MAEPEASTTSAPAKNKIGSLSKEDLVRFVKKQLENVKNSKVEITKLKEQLSEATERESTSKAQFSRRIEELEGKLSFLNDSANVQNTDATASEMILKANVSDLEEKVKKLAEEKKESDLKCKKLSDDVSASKILLDELRSQLEDAKSETAALKEKHTVVDVFSLEIKDYEKKVDELKKELKDSNGQVDEMKRRIENLEAELKATRISEHDLTSEKSTIKEEADTLRKDLYEEKIKSGELKMQLNAVQERLDSLLDDRGGERMELSRELVSGQQRINELEEALEVFKYETEKLRTDREEAENRAEEINKEYTNFKSRAKFVLEQKTKSDQEEQKTNEIAQLEETIKELRDSSELLRTQVSSLQNELSRSTERNSRLESENKSLRVESTDAHFALTNTMDELRSSKTEVEKNLLEKSQLLTRISTLEADVTNVNVCKEKLERLLSSERLQWENEQMKFRAQIDEEKLRSDELQKTVDDLKKQPVAREPKFAPVAAVFPQFSERDSSLEPRCHSSVSNKLSTTSQSDDVTVIQEPSLEDVLFGTPDNDVICTSGEEDGEGRTVESLMEEIESLKKASLNTRELLNESESANGRLIEQSRFLKEEIRRLERNEERKVHAENMEYLKNIIVKFLTPERVALEKQQLIPILNTILRLSDDELAILNRAAVREVTPNANDGSSWGSYIKWNAFS